MENEVMMNLHFPAAGIDVSNAFSRQPNRNVGPGKSDYARTTPVGNNVRAVSPDNRARGSTRSGMTRYINAQPSGLVFVTQMIAVFATEAAGALS